MLQAMLTISYSPIDCFKKLIYFCHLVMGVVLGFVCFHCEDVLCLFSFALSVTLEAEEFLLAGETINQWLPNCVLGPIGGSQLD